MNNLSRSLGTDLPTLAAMLRSKGRGKDSVLAHITPQEAALLKARGGRGSLNPATGLPEFDDVPVVEDPNIEPVTVEGTAPAPVEAPYIAPVQQTVKPNVTPPTISASDIASQANQAVTDPLPISDSQAAAAAAQPALNADTPSALATLSQPATQGQAGFSTPTPQQVTPNLDPTAAASSDQNVYTPPSSPELDPSLGQNIKSWLSDNSTLLSILGLGGLAGFGAVNSSKASGAAANLQSNLSSLATPFTSAGDTALNTTLAGGLTPQNMQVLQATQAQIADQQSRGAVSSQQASEAISTTFANLLQTQLNQALQLLGTADQYLQTAYLQGYQANATTATNTQNFYSNLAQLAGNISGLTTTPAKATGT